MNSIIALLLAVFLIWLLYSKSNFTGGILYLPTFTGGSGSRGPSGANPFMP